jgi:hypothetical protein
MVLVLFVRAETALPPEAKTAVLTRCTQHVLELTTLSNLRLFLVRFVRAETAPPPEAKTINIKNVRTTLLQPKKNVKSSHPHDTQVTYPGGRRISLPFQPSSTLKLPTEEDLFGYPFLFLFLAGSSDCGLLAPVVCVSSSAIIRILKVVEEEFSSDTCSEDGGESMCLFKW